MDDLRVGRLRRALRRRRGWRQADLADRAGTSQSVISELERGRLAGMTVGVVRRIGGVLGASTELELRGLGADTDRLLDARHAGLVGATTVLLRAAGWHARPETSYSEWGERGSIDLLGWHEATRSLLVVEVKSELASLEATLRKHDEKARLGPAVATKRLGWRPETVSRLIVLPATRTTSRRLAAHATVLDTAYPVRGRPLRAWLQRPTGELSGLLLVTDIAPGRGMARTAGPNRVRIARRRDA